jgi:hypothetical protein
LELDEVAGGVAAIPNEVVNRAIRLADSMKPG